MSLEALVNARDSMFTSMMEAITIGSEGQPAAGSPEDTRQFVAGFIDLVVHAAQGNMGPRDQYLSIVVPAIKQAGMPLGVVMAGMMQVGLGGAHAMDEEAYKWWVAFVSDYMHRLCAAWEAA